MTAAPFDSPRNILRLRSPSTMANPESESKLKQLMFLFLLLFVIPLVAVLCIGFAYGWIHGWIDSAHK